MLRELFAGTAGQINSISGSPAQTGQTWLVEITFNGPQVIDIPAVPFDVYAFHNLDQSTGPCVRVPRT